MKKLLISMMTLTLMGSLQAMSPDMGQWAKEAKMARKWEEEEELRRYDLPLLDEETKEEFKEEFEEYRAAQKKRVDSIYDKLKLPRGWEEEKQTAPTIVMLMSLELDADTIANIIEGWRNEGYLFPNEAIHPLIMANAILKYAATNDYIAREDAERNLIPEESFRLDTNYVESDLPTWTPERKGRLILDLIINPQNYVVKELLRKLAAWGLDIKDGTIEDYIRALIDWGADPNAKDKDDMTILMWAAVRNVDVVQALINAGAYLDAQNTNDESALSLATLHNRPDSVQALINAGAYLDLHNIHGTTALMYAANKGYIGIARALIDNGADVNAIDNEGRTALISASDVEIIRALIDAGADVNIKDNEGRTALTYALSSARVNNAAVPILREHGALGQREDLFEPRRESICVVQ